MGVVVKAGGGGQGGEVREAEDRSCEIQRLEKLIWHHLLLSESQAVAHRAKPNSYSPGQVTALI